jgi:hypothetical protein
VQSSTIKTAINFMIYGVSILMFDFEPNKRISEPRIEKEAFFTNRKKATEYYLYHKRQWDNEKGIVYGRKQQRGRCEMYKASVLDGQIMNHGITIYKETI